MKSFKYLLFSILIIPTLNLSAQMNTSLETAFQSVLSKKTELVQKEALVKLVSARVQKKFEILMAANKPTGPLAHFAATLHNTSTPFSLPKESEIPSLDANIRSGKLTLQARANGPTPVFYTGSLHEIFGGSSGTGLMLDEYNQIDPVEMVALSGATFQIV